MSDLPAEFDCTIPDWDYVDRRSRDLAGAVRDSPFDPETVVALARGGWVVARTCCDLLGVDDLTSLKVEHYVGTAEQGEQARVRYPLPDGAVAGKDVLVVDDIVDTGESLRTAVDAVTERDPDTVRTATLQSLPTSGFDPDFVGERLDEWTWVVYPWNFVENMVELVAGALDADGRETATAEEVRRLLAEYHDIGRTELEVAQPGRLREVLDEATRRGVLERVDAAESSADPEWRLADKG